MDLSPAAGIGSAVYLDGYDISSLLEGVDVHAHVGHLTEVVLHTRPGASTRMLVRVPAAQVRVRASHADMESALIAAFDGVGARYEVTDVRRVAARVLEELEKDTP